ncbi:hypothetical protein BDV26DRAFT_260484 [Aspergillus bertholletiae]|uniref:Uncharacterized protein n=1 Tax=Aspergillus bertholletiae TaxID=1226010 RepID=A0A5N7BAV9_9EURO|nr:hypothetical protein BDV26DRAFT_260484 [Aspergillus bertholletiae]
MNSDTSYNNRGVDEIISARDMQPQRLRLVSTIIFFSLSFISLIPHFALPFPPQQERVKHESME